MKPVAKALVQKGAERGAVAAVVGVASVALLAVFCVKLHGFMVMVAANFGR